MGRIAAHYRYLVHFRNLVNLPYRNKSLLGWTAIKSAHEAAYVWHGHFSKSLSSLGGAWNLDVFLSQKEQFYEIINEKPFRPSGKFNSGLLESVQWCMGALIKQPSRNQVELDNICSFNISFRKSNEMNINPVGTQVTQNVLKTVYKRS